VTGGRSAVRRRTRTPRDANGSAIWSRCPDSDPVLAPERLHAEQHVAATISEQGRFYAPYGDAPIALIDAEDVASAAVVALREDGHEGKAFDLTGPEALTNPDLAERYSKVLGREIAWVDVPEADFLKTMRGFGYPEWNLAGFSELWAIYRAG
jgi:uncharacterized protein YbjT (DUF2867 family)